MRRLAPLALLLAAAGCGGAAHRAPPPPPRLPRALAQQWAQQADAVAAALAANDGCSAQQDANALRDEVVQAAPRVPAQLRATLLAAVQALPGRIACAPPPPPPHDHGHGPKDKGPKDNGKKGKGD